MVAIAAPASADEAPATGSPSPVVPAPVVQDTPAGTAAATAATATTDGTEAGTPGNATDVAGDLGSSDGALSNGALSNGAGDARYGLAEWTAPRVQQRGTRSRRLQRVPLGGSLRMVYRHRSSGDESDNDLYQYLRVHAGDENAPGWSGSLHVRVAEDLDGRTDSNQFYVFDSISDTYDSAVTARVYDAYVSYRPARGPVEMVRVGRQYVEGGDLFFLDGVRVDFRAPCTVGHWKGTVFGGRPASIYEDFPEGGILAGGSVERSWDSGLARFDYTHIEDETGYYGDTVNDIFTVTVRQRINRTLSAWGAYQQIDDSPTSIRTHLDGHFEQNDITIRASLFALFDRQNERVNELDPYFAVIQQLERYWTGTFAVTKGIGCFFFVEAGASMRKLFDDTEEGVYNHSFERYHLTLSSDDWLCKGLLLSATGEHWESDDNYQSFAFEAEYRCSKKLRFRAGTDYALYRFDLYAAEERQSVQGYYAEVRFKPSRDWRLHLRVRVEDDAFDTYVTVRTGFDLEF